MILNHDYTGRAGKCRRCGIPRRYGIGMACETPDEIEPVGEGEQ